MEISKSESTKEQVLQLYHFISIMIKPDQNGNSWRFEKLTMYPSFDKNGLYYVIMLLFVDNNDKTLYSIFNRYGNIRHLETLPWEN